MLEPWASNVGSTRQKPWKSLQVNQEPILRIREANGPHQRKAPSSQPSKHEVTHQISRSPAQTLKTLQKPQSLLQGPAEASYNAISPYILRIRPQGYCGLWIVLRIIGTTWPSAIPPGLLAAGRVSRKCLAGKDLTVVDSASVRLLRKVFSGSLEKFLWLDIELLQGLCKVLQSLYRILVGFCNGISPPCLLAAVLAKSLAQLSFMRSRRAGTP